MLLSGCAVSTNPVSDNSQTWVSLNRNLPARLVVDAVAVSAVDAAQVFVGAYGSRGLYSTRDVFGGWEYDAEGLPGTAVFSLLATPSEMFAASAAGLYRRAYRARTWMRADPIPQVAIYALAQDETGVVYAATDGRGIWKSDTADAGWSRVNGLDDEPLTRLLVQDNGQTIFAGTARRGLFVSRDGGANWTGVETFKGAYINALAADPRDARVLYVAPRGGVYRSRDGGETWTALGGGIEREIVHTLLVHPLRNEILVGTNARGLWTSRDEGETWQQAQNPDGSSPFPTRRAVLTIVPQGNFIYVGTEDGLVVSSDLGVSWASTADGLEWNSTRSEDERLGAPNVNALGYGDEFGLAIATQGGLYRLAPESDNRRGYARVLLETERAPVTAIGLAPSDVRRVYAGTDGKGVFVSDDAGASWSAATGELGGKGRIAELMVDPTNAEIVFARVLFERIYKSADGGDSWRTVWTGMPVEEQVQSMALAPGDARQVYAGGDTQFFASEDGGETWQARGLQGISTLALWVDPNDASKVWAGATDGLYITEDAGKTWRGPLLEGKSVSAIVRDASGKFYLGTHYNGVYTTDAVTQTFTRFTGQLLRGSIKGLALKPSEGKIIAATEDGLFCTLFDPAYYTIERMGKLC